MTFRATHPRLHQFIDELIYTAQKEERLQVGVDLHPELKLAAHLRKAQVRTRKARKALVAQLKSELHNRQPAPLGDAHLARVPRSRKKSGGTA